MLARVREAVQGAAALLRLQIAQKNVNKVVKSLAWFAPSPAVRSPRADDKDNNDEAIVDDDNVAAPAPAARELELTIPGSLETLVADLVADV